MIMFIYRRLVPPNPEAERVGVELDPPEEEPPKLLPEEGEEPQPLPEL